MKLLPEKHRVANICLSLMAGILCALALSVRYPVVFDCFNIASAVIAVAAAFLVLITRSHHKLNSERREVIWKIIGLVFGIFNTLGNYMFAYDSLPFYMGIYHIAVFVFLSCVYGFLFYLITYWIRYFLWNRLAGEGSGGFFEKHVFIIAFAVILLCWIPWIIAYYPASMEYDVFRMLKTYLGIIPKDNQHPWFACCALGVFYDLGTALGNSNLGIFLFVIIRDILTALIYAESIRMMKKAGVRRLIQVCSILFFAVTPVWGAYAKHAFKDTFAVALFCLFITWIISLIFKAEAGNDKLFDYLKLGLAGLAASLFRNNYIYYVIPAGILLAVYLLVKKRKIYRVAVMLLCVLLYFAYYAYIYNVEGVREGKPGEALSLPMQQTARTIRDRGDHISEDEKKMLDEYFIYDELADNYDPIISDPVKNRVRKDWQYKIHPEYLKTWLKMGIEHPGVYFSAAVGQTYGYYAFIPKWWPEAGNYNSGMTIFNRIISYDSDLSTFSFAYNENSERMRDLLADYAQTWNDIPLLNITNMIAVYTWMIILITSILIRKRRVGYLIPAATVLLFVVTCIASPVNGCFRYYAGAAASLPVMLSLLTDKKADS